MTAVVTFTEDDLIAAVCEYLAARGWTATRAEIAHTPGDSPRYRAQASVEAPKPAVPAPEPEPEILKPKLWWPREVTIPHGGYPVA